MTDHGSEQYGSEELQAWKKKIVWLIIINIIGAVVWQFSLG